MSELSDRIDFLLEQKGMFRSELARLSKVNEGTIRNWRITEPKAVTLLAVADVLQVSMRWLITGQQDKQGEPTFPITNKEKELLLKFRNLNDHDQKMIVAMLEHAYNSLFFEKSCALDKGSK